MALRTIIVSLIVMATVGLLGLAASGEPNRRPTDPFALDGARNILDEDAFGIVNGKLTVGIPYRERVFHQRPLGAALREFRFQSGHHAVGPAHRHGSLYVAPVPGGSRGLEPRHCGGERHDVGARHSRRIGRGDVEEPGQRTAQVPVAITISGTLDRVGSGGANPDQGWAFGRPQSHTATRRKAADGSLIFSQGDQAIVLRADATASVGTIGSPRRQGSISCRPRAMPRSLWRLPWARRPKPRPTCKKIAADPDRAIAAAQAAYAKQVPDLFQKLPRLESSNPALERLYYRSLVHLLMNRWDVPEFVLHPYYSTGSVKGGCVCNYLWNFGENWEIFPLYDPEASRTHIKQFLAIDMTKHFAFEPIDGQAPLAPGTW